MAEPAARHSGAGRWSGTSRTAGASAVSSRPGKRSRNSCPHSKFDDALQQVSALHQYEVDFLKAEVSHLHAQLGRQSRSKQSGSEPPCGFQLQAPWLPLKQASEDEDVSAGMPVMEEHSCAQQCAITSAKPQCLAVTSAEPQHLAQILMFEAVGVRAFSDEQSVCPDLAAEKHAEEIPFAYRDTIRSSDASVEIVTQRSTGESVQRISQDVMFPHPSGKSVDFKVEFSQSPTEDSFEDSATNVTSLKTMAMPAYEMRDSWLTVYEHVSKYDVADLFAGVEEDGSKGNGELSKSPTLTSLQVFSLKTSAESRPLICSLCRIQNLMVAPDSKIRIAWCTACMTFLLYDIITVPLDASFDLGREDGTLLGIAQFIARCFWTIDIVMTFFIGLTVDDRVVMDPYKVAKMYVRSWFLFDFSLVMFEWLSYSLIEQESANSASMLRGARTLRIVRMVRLLRLARVVKLKLALSEVVVLSSECLSHVASFVTVTVVLAIAIHLSACIWHLFGNALTNGWVERCALSSAPLAERYAISWHAVLLHTHSGDCEKSMGFLETLLDCSMLFGWIVTFAWYIGMACLTVTAYSNSDESQIQKMTKAYIKRHHISKQVRRRVLKFHSAQHMEGLGETLAAEARLFSVLPIFLQEDLTSEARCPILCTYQCLADLNTINPRVQRNLCNQATSNLLAIESEVVFAPGDACSQMLFIMQGELRYLTNGSTSIEDGMCDESVSPRSRSEFLKKFLKKGVSSASLSDAFKQRRPSTSAALLGEGVYLCEAVLWTHWEHCGELVANKDSLMLSLRVNDFIEVIMQHRTACVYAAKYARHFVRRLNSTELSDVLALDIVWSDLDEEMFKSEKEDHFMFLSHYKQEAGTEATLMRDALDRLIKENPRHWAANLASPVFMDSENLADLSMLMTHVERSSVLLLLLTPGILTRPWCLMEIVTAWRHDLQIIPIEIQRPGMKYAYPDEKFYQQLRKGEIVPLEGIRLLEQEGVNMQEVDAAIRQVFMKIALPFSPHKSGNIRQAELEDILQRSGISPSRQKLRTSVAQIGFNRVNETPSS